MAEIRLLLCLSGPQTHILSIVSCHHVESLDYSHTLVLVDSRTRQTLYSLHFDERKMFWHLAPARHAEPLSHDETEVNESVS